MGSRLQAVVDPADSARVELPGASGVLAILAGVSGARFEQGSLFEALRPEGAEDLRPRRRAPRPRSHPVPPADPGPIWAEVPAPTALAEPRNAEPPAPPLPSRELAAAVLAALDQAPRPARARAAEPNAAPPPAEPAEPASLEASLQRVLGFSSFRPGQREVVEAVLAGRDALAVMPTGAGKSLTYSLPAFLLPGVTLVVSPLIALMQDQVAKLRARGLPAAVINSQVPWEEQRRTLDELAAGAVKLLLVAPERFRSERFVRALRGAQVSLFAVDEAHCVSQWGHDFRPDYLRLGEAARACGRPPILAVTATATRDVQQDIREQLGLTPDALTLVRGFDRENLFLAAPLVQGGAAEKLRRLEGCLGALRAGGGRGPGIVYCATRRNCERVARGLSRAKLGRVAIYHAGMRPAARARTQERFFAGKLDVVVATNAFGLGIDKQDLRFVVHHDLPGSLEAYYQEAGRAGRDGAAASCALLFAPQDIHLQRFFIETSHPDRRAVEQVALAARHVGWDPDRIERRLAGAVKGRAIESAVRLLEAAGGDPGAVDHARVLARARHEQRLLERMIDYAQGRRCLRAVVLDYFGADEVPGRCEGCDRCRPEASPIRAAAPRAATARAATPAAPRTRARSATKRAPRAARERATAEPTPPADPELLGALRQLRARLAKKKRVAPYKVFHDRTLLALAAARPQTREALLAVYGIGERKAALYGGQLLEVLRRSG